MSSNLAVSNFAVGGTLGVTGVVTLSSLLTSSASASFKGLSTDELPSCNRIPTTNTELTNKLYVNEQDGILNTRITNVDNTRKTYVDVADGVLNTRITNVDNTRKTYVDVADGVLNTRITNVDNTRKTYVDVADGVLNTKIESTDALRKEYIDNKNFVKIINLPKDPNKFNEDNFFTNQDFDITTVITHKPSADNSPQLYLPNSKTCGGKTCIIYNETGRVLEINRSAFYNDGDIFNRFRNMSDNGSGTTVVRIQHNETIKLISITENWLVLNTYTHKRFYFSGQELQTRVYSARNATFTNTIINSTVETEIFGYNFTPQSTNSSIYATFDCYNDLTGTGSGTEDSFQSKLAIGDIDVGFKFSYFSNDQRNISTNLFPISGHRLNTSLDTIRIKVTGTRLSGNDDLNITGTAWSMYITEIQN